MATVVQMSDVDRDARPTPETQPTQPKGIDPTTGEPCVPVEIPVPRRGTWDRLLHRAENTSPPTD